MRHIGPSFALIKSLCGRFGKWFKNPPPTFRSIVAHPTIFMHFAVGLSFSVFLTNCLCFLFDFFPPENFYPFLVARCTSLYSHISNKFHQLSDGNLNFGSRNSCFREKGEIVMDSLNN